MDYCTAGASGLCPGNACRMHPSHHRSDGYCARWTASCRRADGRPRQSARALIMITPMPGPLSVRSQPYVHISVSSYLASGLARCCSRGKLRRERLRLCHACFVANALTLRLPAKRELSRHVSYTHNTPLRPNARLRQSQEMADQAPAPAPEGGKKGGGASSQPQVRACLARLDAAAAGSLLAPATVPHACGPQRRATFNPAAAR